jgi:hypothetical protein
MDGNLLVRSCFLPAIGVWRSSKREGATWTENRIDLHCLVKLHAYFDGVHRQVALSLKEEGAIKGLRNPWLPSTKHFVDIPLLLWISRNSHRRTVWLTLACLSRWNYWFSVAIRAASGIRRLTAGFVHRCTRLEYLRLLTMYFRALLSLARAWIWRYTFPLWMMPMVVISLSGEMVVRKGRDQTCQQWQNRQFDFPLNNLRVAFVFKTERSRWRYNPKHVNTQLATTWLALSIRWIVSPKGEVNACSCSSSFS